MSGAFLALGLATAPLLAASPANADTSGQWALSYLKYSQANALSTGSGVTVGLIDTGVAPIANIASQLVPGADYTGGVVNEGDVGNGEADADADGHGNGMASVIAGQGQPVQGLAPQAKIMPIRDMLTSGLMGGPNSAASSVQYAISQHLKVINISQGWADGQAEKAAIAQAVAANIVVVVSAGNDTALIDDETSPAPADDPGVVVVSAIDQNGAIASFSDYGPQVTLAAPGVDILNDENFPNYTTSASGTSPAAAFVSATAALIFSEHPTWTAGQVIRDLISTADPGAGQAADQHDDHFGYGIIDPLKALQAAAPSETTNPLSAASSAAPSAGASAIGSGSSTGAAAPASSSSSGSSALLIILGVLVVLVALVVVIVLTRRGKGGSGKGGKDGGSSGSGDASGPPSGAGTADRAYQHPEYRPQQQYPPK